VNFKNIFEGVPNQFIGDRYLLLK